MAANKTDANDADGLAQLAEVGFFRAVRVKGFDSMLTRTLVAARTRFWLPLLDIIRLRAPLWRGFSFERRQNNPALPETERAPKGGFCPVLQRPTGWLGI